MLGTVFGCTKRNIVECEGNATCVAFAGGECRLNVDTGNRWCAYPDSACASGLRWSEANTGDGLDGQCVDLGIDGGTPCTPQVIWLSNVDGDLDIWISDLDGTNQNALTVNDDIEYTTAWSPAGDRIAFSRLGLIWVMNADGTDQHPITDGPDSRPQWSPDGATIMFARGEGPGMYSLWTVSADGGAPVPLTTPDNVGNQLSYSWSPDGAMIAFSSNRDGDTEVYVMTATGASETNITNSSGSTDGGDVQWSPDGDLIAFISDRGGDVDIWTMSPTGATPRDLNATTTSAAIYGYDWFPDGSQIIYATFGLGPSGGVSVMNSDGTGQQTVIPVADSGDLYPQVSGDGSMIAWLRAAPDPEIMVANSDGSSMVRISNAPGQDEQPRFRPCP
jgi:TolB protein